mgnify:CR=1 FL=1
MSKHFDVIVVGAGNGELDMKDSIDDHQNGSRQKIGPSDQLQFIPAQTPLAWRSAGGSQDEEGAICAGHPQADAGAGPGRRYAVCHSILPGGGFPGRHTVCLFEAVRQPDMDVPAAFAERLYTLFNGLDQAFPAICRAAGSAVWQ